MVECSLFAAVQPIRIEMDEDCSEEGPDFGRNSQLSEMVPDNEESGCHHDSLREEFAELGITCTTQHQFYKKFLRVQQQVGLSPQQEVQQYKLLWDMSTTLKPTSRLNSLRVSIALEYVRLLSNAGQVEMLCRWLADTMVALQKEHHLLNVRNSDLHVLYFLLAKHQIMAERFTPAAATFTKIEQLIKTANESQRKTLHLKLLFLKSKYQQAKGNNEQQFQQLRKAVDYIKHHHIESNFASKLSLFFHKLQAKRAKELSLVSKNLRRSTHKEEVDRFRTSIRQKENAHEIRKSVIKIRPSTATRPRSILKSLHEQAKPHQPASKSRQSQHSRQQWNATAPITFPDFGELTALQPLLANILMARPQYSKTPPTSTPHSKIAQLPPESLKQIQEAQLESNSHLPVVKDSYEEVAPELEVSYTIDQGKDRKKCAEGKNMDDNSQSEEDNQSEEESFLPENGILGHDEPRRSLLDEFIDLSSAYKVKYNRVPFFCKEEVLRLVGAEFMFVQQPNRQAGFTVFLQLAIEDSHGMIRVRHEWEAERFLNCKARLVDFLHRILKQPKQSSTSSREEYNEQIKLAVYKLVMQYLTPTLTIHRYRLSLDTPTSRRSSAFGRHSQRRQSTEFYRNISILDKIKKTTSQFIEFDNMDMLTVLHPQDAIDEAQRASLRRNLCRNSSGPRQPSFHQVLSTVQGSGFWNTGSTRVSSIIEPSKSTFSKRKSGRVSEIQGISNPGCDFICEPPPNASQIKEWLVTASSDESDAKRSLQIYFDSAQLKSQYPIRNRGKCMLSLTAYTSKPIFSHRQQFFKLEAALSKSLTNVMKFVATSADISMVLGCTVAHPPSQSQMHLLMVKLAPLLFYDKERIYWGLSIDIAGTCDHYSYRSKLIEHSHSPEGEAAETFLSRKLKKVRHLAQRIIKLRTSTHSHYLLLSMQMFEGYPCVVVKLYSPQTGRNVTFQVGEEQLKTVQQHDLIPVLDSQVGGQHSCGGTKLASLFSLSFVRFEDKQCLCADFAGERIFTEESNWCKFTEIAGKLLRVEFRLVPKGGTHGSLLTQPFSSITMQELQLFAVFLQFSFAESNTKVNLRFGLQDLVCLVLECKRVRNHPQLACPILNLSDLNFLFSRAYSKVCECLQGSLKHMDPTEICGSIDHMRELHSSILRNIQSSSEGDSPCSTSKLSMNCYKGKEKCGYFEVMYKGVLRLKKRTLVGIFFDKGSNSCLVRTEDKQVRRRKVQMDQISTAFVPDERKVELLKHCHQRLFRSLKNRLLLWDSCG